ncbi:hypothetical protein GH714_037048 [Hevea brasiliensis]|uniref:NAC domain-containing protein n=1 Tax=Hevea brasiliensis TaxID=3981 RepID=A0A6A6KF03_HEVBR|nr:hypothetical protein GH714_037048 [Hevea brasiliensis]
MNSTTGPPQLVMQNVPVGWRFHPSEEELVDYYLKKRRGDPIDGMDIGEVDKLCDHDPKDLPDLFKNKSKDKVWYFFCLRLHHKNGLTNRKGKGGYWKSTGDPRWIMAEDSDEVIGIKRTLVFHNPDATQWVIHEYEYTAAAAINTPTEIKSNKKEKASKRSKKAEPDCRTRPKKKARKCESDSNLTSASSSTSKNKKLEETIANSAYGEGEPSNNTILDLENQNLSETSCPTASYLENLSPNEMTVMSSYKEVEPSSQRASGLGNQSPYEITTLSTNNKSETSCFRTCDFENHNSNVFETCDFENHNSNVFEKVTPSYLVPLDFEKQDPSKILDTSASIEGEQFPLLETPSDFEHQNQYRKVDVSVNENHRSPSMASNTGETKSQGMQSQYKKTNMPFLEDCPGSSMGSNIQDVMYQEGQSQYDIEIPIPEDDDLLSVFGVDKFPEISPQLVDELMASFDPQDSLNSAPQPPICVNESLNSNAMGASVPI